MFWTGMVMAIPLTHREFTFSMAASMPLARELSSTQLLGERASPEEVDVVVQLIVIRLDRAAP
eukprot:11160341-Lingulodinium_polyedra.AAC.1